MTNSMHIAIIDDEPKARSFLRNLIDSVEADVFLVGEAESVEGGVAMINATKPQAILLDVELEDGTGFDLLNQLDYVKPHVVFVTAFDHYAVQAFRADAIDYLEKPVHPNHLLEAIAKVEKRIQSQDAPIYPSLVQHIKERVAVPTRYGTLYVKTDEILYVKADGAYSEIHLENSQKPHVVSRKLAQVEASLGNLGFVRIHRSYMANVAKVRELSRTDGGYVILEGGLQIPFSRHYREEAYQKIKELTTGL